MPIGEPGSQPEPRPCLCPERAAASLSPVPGESAACEPQATAHAHGLWDHRAVGNDSLPATARLAAAGRAVESRRGDRLFEDPLAEALAGEEGFRLMERWRLPGAPRENPTIGPRTRFYDDLVIEAVADGLGQVVLVAAGMDTRTFRLALPAEVIVFELDLPEMLSRKQAILDREQAMPRCRRMVVAADLGGDDWPQTLIGGGFDPAIPTVFIVEGLSWYLTEEQNAGLLDDLARLAAPGSRLGIDIISRENLESPAAAPFFEFTATLGIVWQFGTDDPAEFLATHGWEAEVTGLDAFARRLGRRAAPDPAEDPANAVSPRQSDLRQRKPRHASVLLH